MPFCPRCRAEYREGFTACVPCGDIPLVEKLLAADQLTDDELENTLPVRNSDSELTEVEVEGVKVDYGCVFPLDVGTRIREMLQEKGIPSAIVGSPAEFPDGRPRFEVRVRKETFEEAQEHLVSVWKSQVEAEGGSVSENGSIEACPACGSHVPLDVNECPDCGLFVGSSE